MASERHCRQLADRIREVLKQGIPLDDEVMHYIDSTYSMPTAEQLHEMLSQPADSQDDSLRELIFSPDESIQLQIEDLLEEKAFKKTDEEKVVSYLLERPVETGLYSTDRRVSLTQHMPRSNIERFVSQLNIGQHMDSDITAAVHRHLDCRQHAAVNLRLRNRRFKLTGNNIDFLCTMIEKLGPGTEDFLACFEFMLGLFEETPDDDDIYRLLRLKKRFYFKALQASEKFHEQWKNSNMETLILQGVRTPYIDPTNAENRMELIDRISYAVFGKIEYIEKRDVAVRFDEYDKNPGAYQ